VTGRWSADAGLRARPIKICDFAVVGSALVDRVKLNSTRNRPRTLLGGVP
jgi:hypothetical protein